MNLTVIGAGKVGYYLTKTLLEHGHHPTIIESDHARCSHAANDLDIPVIWYHTDGHPDYHMPSDHVEKINWNKIVDITKASFLNMWNLANEKDY